MRSRSPGGGGVWAVASNNRDTERERESRRRARENRLFKKCEKGNQRRAHTINAVGVGNEWIN